MEQAYSRLWFSVTLLCLFLDKGCRTTISITIHANIRSQTGHDEASYFTLSSHRHSQQQSSLPMPGKNTSQLQGTGIVLLLASHAIVCSINIDQSWWDLDVFKTPKQFLNVDAIRFSHSNMYVLAVCWKVPGLRVGRSFFSRIFSYIIEYSKQNAHMKRFTVQAKSSQFWGVWIKTFYSDDML